MTSYVGQLVVRIFNNNNIFNDFLVISRIYQIVNELILHITNDDIIDIQGNCSFHTIKEQHIVKDK
jgi:hypothetical protein